MAKTLRLGIDVGGTFTDLAALDTATGERLSLKVTSTPHAPELGVIAALDQLIARFPQPPQFEHIAHSTTIATNALLGQINLELPRVVFITTAGFRDVIEIGRQNRSEVYNLFVKRPAPLAERSDRIAVRERMDYRGRALLPLESGEIERVVKAMRDLEGAPAGAIAVGFLHSYVNGEHEHAMGEALRKSFPDIPVTLSCEIDPEYREYERFSTAVVNAALMPIVQGYLDRLESAVRDRGISAPLYVMQSNGGLTSAKNAAKTPAAIIESGPASGVIAAAALARETGVQRALSFDMGGTSAKAGTIVDGIVQVASEFEAAGATHSGRSVKGSGYPVRFPFVDLAEISAGGGTIAWIDAAGALRIGPLSAGADPGPACYGRSDRATVTDANVVLGRLNQTALAGGTFPIDARRSYETIANIGGAIGLSAQEAAAGIVRIVDSQMAKVLHIVTTERGLDPRDFTLIAFGGNGPLHACALAGELGIRRIVVPASPGVFSADGLLVAPLRAAFLTTLLADAGSLEDARLDALFSELETKARSTLGAQGANGTIAMRRHFDARYRGQSFELEIAAGKDPARTFHDAHRRRYGYDVPNEPVELVSARVTATAELPEITRSTVRRTTQAAGSRWIWLGEYVEAPVLQRESLANATRLAGPALIEQPDTCTYVAPGWHAVTDDGTLVVEQMQ